MPASTVGGEGRAARAEQVSDRCRAAVLQLDLVGFTRMSARLPPMRLAQMVKPTCPSSFSFSGSVGPLLLFPTAHALLS